MHENWGTGKSFFCPMDSPMDKKMVSPNIEWCIGKVLVCAQFSLKFSHGTLSLCVTTQLFWLFGILKMFSIFMPKLCSGGFIACLCLCFMFMLFHKSNKGIEKTKHSKQEGPKGPRSLTWRKCQGSRWSHLQKTTNVVHQILVEDL